MEIPQTAWWERDYQRCRDEYIPAESNCSYNNVMQIECRTELDDLTGKPVKKCVKLHRRLLKCPGMKEPLVEENHEMYRSNSDGLPAPSKSIGFPRSDIAAPELGQALEEFLSFAEELQQQIAPNHLDLDSIPKCAAIPHDTIAQRADGNGHGGFMRKLFYNRPKEEEEDSPAWEAYRNHFQEI